MEPIPNMADDEMPWILDLFCGEGGAAMGYARAGFNVFGVDHKPQPNYPFHFEQADVFDWLSEWDISEFAAIHASPPCQFHSTITSAEARKRHFNLIPPTRAALKESGLPYVIENVEGAKARLRNPLKLCGSSFGLAVRRHRYFETSFRTKPVACQHGSVPAIGVYGMSKEKLTYVRANGYARNRKAANEEEASAALGGVDWMSWAGMTQCVPPAYTEHIGAQLLSEVL